MVQDWKEDIYTPKIFYVIITTPESDHFNGSSKLWKKNSCRDITTAK